MPEQSGPAWEPPGWATTDPDQAQSAPAPGSSAPPGWGVPAQPGWNAAPPGWGGPPQAPHPGVVPLRPLGLGEILDGAVTVIRRYPRPALGLSALVALGATLLNVGLVVALGGGFSGSSDETADGSEIAASLTVSLGQVAVTTLAGILLTGIITALVGRAVLGREIGMAEAWSQARPYVWRLLGLSLLTLLLVLLAFGVPTGIGIGLVAAVGPAGLIGTVPLVIGGLVLGVYVYVRLALASPAMLLEKAGIRTSMRRSGLLVKGAFWRTFGILLLTVMITQTVATILQLPFLLPSMLSDSLATWQLVVGQIGTGLALLVTQPFSSGVTALLYIDRRMRAEGLDVTLASAAARST